MVDGNSPFFGWGWIDTCKMVPCSQLAADGFGASPKESSPSRRRLTNIGFGSSSSPNHKLDG